VSYIPKRYGKPEGFPWSPLDGSQAQDRLRTYTVIGPEPKAAMTVSLKTGISLPNTVTQLRQLEIRKAVKRKTDEAGVMRWTRDSGAWFEPPPF
jgi:hypothetical protein